MLGLTQEIGGDHLRVGCVVGDHHHLGGAGEEVDADLAEELTLRLGHVGVARPDEHVDRSDRLRAECHRGDSLHTADDVDLVGAGERHRGHRLPRWTSIHGRRAGDDVPNPGHLGRQDAHVGGRDHRVPPTRHIAADRVDRDVLVSEHDARDGLDLEVVHRRQLRFGEATDLRLREPDVVDGLGWNGRDDVGDLGRAEPERSG